MLIEVLGHIPRNRYGGNLMPKASFLPGLGTFRVKLLVNRGLGDHNLSICPDST